jgi:hypothetical protein
VVHADGFVVRVVPSENVLHYPEPDIVWEAEIGAADLAGVL